jgi:predicted nucleic acid-binding protein
VNRIFLDTNVLLDFVLDRKPFSDEAEDIFQLKIVERKKLFTSVLSMANVAYVVRKAKMNPFLVLDELVNWIDLVSLTKEDFEMARASKFKDFEDALQYYSAASIKADAIISRDVKGFSISSIPVYTPNQFLKDNKK